jgi:hypothetical protein
MIDVGMGTGRGKAELRRSQHRDQLRGRNGLGSSIGTTSADLPSVRVTAGVSLITADANLTAGAGLPSSIVGVTGYGVRPAMTDAGLCRVRPKGLVWAVPSFARSGVRGIVVGHLGLPLESNLSNLAVGVLYQDAAVRLLDLLPPELRGDRPTQLLSDRDRVFVGKAL